MSTIGEQMTERERWLRDRERDRKAIQRQERSDMLKAIGFVIGGAAVTLGALVRRGLSARARGAPRVGVVMGNDHEDHGGGGRMLTLLLVAAAVIAGLYLAFGTGPAPPREDAAKAARAWADTMGIRITGVHCDGWRCEVAPEQGPPIVLLCGEMCHLEKCQ